ncbi:MAG TPA: hypothetical protein PL123_01245 [Bacteroidales bacterium]|nr:hypothetical protein [Bacteroidales bacterium]
MKVKYHSLFLLLLFFGTSLTAQNLFREGYVEKQNGSVLNGLIEYKPTNKIPSNCVFKRFDIAEKIEYSADKIISFGYNNGKRYESFKSEGKTLFYEVLIKGKISVYTNGSGYFLKKENGSFTELKKTNISDSGASYDNLISYLETITEGKCGPISKNFSLNEDLLPLIESYNKNSGSGYYTFNRSFSEKEFINQSGLTGAYQFRYGILSGINVYKLSLGIAPGVTYTGNLFFPVPESESGPVAGVFLEKLLLRKSDKLALRVELLYEKQNFYCYSESKYSIYTSRHDAFFDFTAISVPVLLQYSFTGNRLVPYINTGVAYQHFLSGSYYHTEEKETAYSLPEISTYEDSNLSIDKKEYKALLGAGLRYRLINRLNLNLQARIAYGSGLFVNSPPQGYSSGASYKKFYSQNSLQYSLMFGISF